MTFVKPSVSPNPVRCNQCKLVCRNVADLQDHARVTGHAHKPMYFCTVCSITLNKLKDKRDHVTATGHYPPSRTVDLATGTVTTTPSSSGVVSDNFWVVFLWTNDHALMLTLTHRMLCSEHSGYADPARYYGEVSAWYGR